MFCIKESVAMPDTLSTQTQSMDETPAEPEPAAAPAEEMITVSIYLDTYLQL